MKAKIAFAAIIGASIILFSGCSSTQTAAPVQEQKVMDQNQTQSTSSSSTVSDQTSTTGANADQNQSDSSYVQKYNSASIETNFGMIKVKLYNADAPVTVNNFLKLADQKFYDGTKFHRFIKGFMIQGGDPNSKQGDPSTWGMGGPGYTFNDELKGTEKYPQGTLAMANSGPNTNGSQFFIVTASPEAPLPPRYTVFGMVVSGLDVALKIENVKTVAPGQIDRPVEDVIIKNITSLSEK